MVHIYYDDEGDNLTPELRNLMQQAADAGIAAEFAEELGAAGIFADDIDAEVSVSIVTDDEILELNREYREKDKVTDVLSFPQYAGREEIASELLRDDERGGTLLGDIVICYDQAMRQAEEYRTGLTRELLYLFVHSLMHLFGYDHEEDEERRIMRRKEEEVLQSVGVG